MDRIPEPQQTPEGPAYEGRLLDRPDDEVVDQGVSFDVRTLVSRRGLLGLVGLGVGAATLAACSATTASGSTATPSATATATATPTPTPTTTAAGTAFATEEIPQETNGPYPADGTNGVNILEESGIVRSDIRTSLDGGATAEGVPLSLTFAVSDMANGNAPFAGAAVYAWQCDAQGRYSMYSQEIIDETYLRGVQVVGADGLVTFQTIVPGCYSGRWTHIHFEVYPDVASATTGDNQIATSQVAFPQDMVEEVYALDSYPGSSSNLARIGSLDNDNVFGDGYALEMATFTGDVSSGYIGSLAVAIDTNTTPTLSAAPGGGNGGGPGR
jgi:protocatechuate 3,4-dioxygenase beta subunit